MTSEVRSLRLATRASRLARWQAATVTSALHRAHDGLETSEMVVTTEGDRDPDTPLPVLGGAGVFTDALDQAVLTGEADLAVHSLKDLPVDRPPELELAAIGFRTDPRDVMIARKGWTLANLPRGAVVGTCSLRRSAQLLAVRPDLDIRPLRGNVDTRIRKALAGEYDAIVIAAAGVERLGEARIVSEYLSLDVMLPAPGQGALAVEGRRGDQATGLAAALDDRDTRAACQAERAFLTGLGGGCTAPVAASGAIRDGRLHVRGLVASADGRTVVRVEQSGDPAGAAALGAALADEALARGAARALAS